MIGHDRRTIDKLVVNLSPVGQEGNAKLYALADVEGVLKSKPDKSLKDEKLAEEIRKLKIKNDRDEGKLVLKIKVLEVWEKMSGQMRFIQDQKLENEYPAVVAGLDVPQARVYGKRLNDSLTELIQRAGEELKVLG